MIKIIIFKCILIFFFTFLPLQVYASITFFKQVSVDVGIKLFDEGNSTIAFIDEDDHLHMYNLVEEELEHKFSENIGFDVQRFRKAYKQVPNLKTSTLLFVEIRMPVFLKCRITRRKEPIML